MIVPASLIAAFPYYDRVDSTVLASSGTGTDLRLDSSQTRQLLI